MTKITLIIPLRLTAETYEGELRLRRLVAAIPRDLFDILIADYGTSEAHAKPLRLIEASGVEVVRHPRPERLFSIGKVRDFGAVMARNPVIMFNDVDFYGSPDMYRAIHAEAMRRDLPRNRFDFFTVPVLFLTEAGVDSWFSDMTAGLPFIKESTPDWLESQIDLVQSTAFGSSAMVVNRDHYLSLGGHAPEFSGHGAEDYDILHRLAALAPKGPRPHAYLTDFKDNGVSNYGGFRAFFALYGLEPFARGVHLVHLWHPRRREKGYFRPGPNFRLLRRLMRAFDKTGAMPLPLSDGRGRGAWLVYCRSAADVMLMRQILPHAARYRIVKRRRAPGPARLLADARDMRADAIIVAPDVAGPVVAPEGEGLEIHRFVRRANAGEFDVIRSAPHISSGAEALGGRALDIRSERGGVLFRYWARFDGGALGRIESGDIPPRLSLDNPVFASFGGAEAATRARRARIRPRKKSSWWVRLKRRLTGL
jgi:predicted glycosyltransferase involved in capsule biosynthesis